MTLLGLLSEAKCGLTCLMLGVCEENAVLSRCQSQFVKTHYESRLSCSLTSFPTNELEERIDEWGSCATAQPGSHEDQKQRQQDGNHPPGFVFHKKREELSNQSLLLFLRLLGEVIVRGFRGVFLVF